MSKDQDATPKSKVIEKLKQHRDANSGEASILLPQTNVRVSYPKFRNHGVWMQSMRMAKNDVSTAQTYYVCKVATFDGENMTATDFSAFIPMGDASELLVAIFGGAEDEDETGKPGLH